MRYTIAIVIGLLIAACPVSAQEFHVDEQVGDLFKEAGVLGAFVIYDVQSNSYTVYNPVRAKKRFVPASTFKIANSLIGLSVGAVKDVDEILPYGGKPQPFKPWEKDMGLRDAIKISNVPIYQELARRIGLKRMQQQVRQLNYGNSEIGSSVDTFWLEGPLKISAVEQTRFLAKLAQHQLGYSKKIQEVVCDIILLENNSDVRLFGKTGWSKNIGWWVGWVEKSGRVYSFALNMDMAGIEDAPKRVAIGKKSLRLLKILD